MIPKATTYWLCNVRVPAALLEGVDPGLLATRDRDDLVRVDLQIAAGAIAQIAAAGDGDRPQPAVDWRGGQVWPCFVDLHTHLDKGHTWERTPNPDGSFESAITKIKQDAAQHWQFEDLYRRMEFGLRCSYAHGTQALRTHLDCYDNGLATTNLAVFRALKDAWAGRLELQAVTLTSIDTFLTPLGDRLADQIAEVGGVLGGLVLMHPELPQQLDRVFQLAQERGLPLDFHTDETGDPSSITLRYIAEAALRNGFEQQIVCGHCCSLAVQQPEAVMATIRALQQVRAGVVSLPMCNLYLQDRAQSASQRWVNLSESLPGAIATTPRWRGVTLIHELKHQGIPVALASDNCRDVFHSFGDHDVLEVFSQSVRIAHLDRPYGDWPQAVTKTAADLMGLPQVGRIAPGLPANLVLFRGRSYSELLSRPQGDRVVLRQGQPIDTTLPDYAELDDLVGGS